ncbi:hypothetical protein [Bradyrhizobium sp. RT5a]|uniref:hypothetical protein n=1 Tax=Bradyrhizobium sp. RT5a TaxID=3156380 RepID=UPI003395C0C7
MPEYFECGAPYRDFVDKCKPAKAVEEGLAYLAARRVAVGDQQYRLDHKGTPFYILGYSAFACHDYTSASLYFDAAAEADLRYHQGNLDTPALRFIQILHAPNEDLLAREIIARIETQIQALLAESKPAPARSHRLAGSPHSLLRANLKKWSALSPDATHSIYLIRG